MSKERFVVIGMEESQEVTKAFRAFGIQAFSCDLQPCSGGREDIHFQEDIVEHLRTHLSVIDFLGLHPVCKYLTNSSVRWLARKKPTAGFTWSEKYQIYIDLERYKKMEEAAAFFIWCLEMVRRVGRGYVENPVMHRYAREIIKKKYTQVIQPWMFGKMETKKTCLWLIGLPPLQATDNVYGEMMKLDYKDRAKCHCTAPGPDREKIRSKTLSEVAGAMASQWHDKF